MKREFLETLGLTKEAVDQIMAEHGADLQREKARADQLRTELTGVQEQLTQREQEESLTRAIAAKGVKFSSLAAQRDFLTAARSQNLIGSEGAPEALEEFIQSRRESDPGAFAPEKEPPRFITGGGGGHAAPGGGLSAAEMMAEAIGKAGAARDRAARDVIAAYKGGNDYGA